MFERYSENAKQSFVYARYEAKELRSPEINDAHVFLGLLRDSDLIAGVLGDVPVQEIRENILARLRGHTQSKLSAPNDLPLSEQAKQTLASATELANKSGSRYVGNAHVLFALLRSESSMVVEVLRRMSVFDNIRSQLDASILGETEQDRVVGGTRFADRTDRTLELTVLDLAKLEGDLRALKLVDYLLAESKSAGTLRIRQLWFIATVFSRALGDMQLVRHYCEELLAVDPEDPLALYVLADCVQKQGKLAEAKQYAERSYAVLAQSKSIANRGLFELLTSQWPDLHPNT
jgi:tetratricopeptide (TPR) repeat protein